MLLLSMLLTNLQTIKMPQTHKPTCSLPLFSPTMPLTPLQRLPLFPQTPTQIKIPRINETHPIKRSIPYLYKTNHHQLTHINKITKKTLILKTTITYSLIHLRHVIWYNRTSIKTTRIKSEIYSIKLFDKSINQICRRR